MPILHIEHAITDLDTWLQAFSRFAAAREQAGVIGTQIWQPADDDSYIVVHLRFETIDAAAHFQDFLQKVVWSSPDASPALVGNPKSRLLEDVQMPAIAGKAPITTGGTGSQGDAGSDGAGANGST